MVDINLSMAAGMYWSAVLGVAMRGITTRNNVVAVSVARLVVRLRMASCLGAGLLNATRLVTAH